MITGYGYECSSSFRGLQGHYRERAQCLRYSMNCTDMSSGLQWGEDPILDVNEPYLERTPRTTGLIGNIERNQRR